MGAFTTIAGALIGLLTALAAIFRGHDTVREGSLGLKYKFGVVERDKFGNVRIIQPGWVWLVPFAHKLRQMEARRRQIETDPQVVELADKAAYEVVALIVYGVRVTQSGERDSDSTNGLYHGLVTLSCDNGSRLDFFVSSQLAAIVGEHLSGIDQSATRLEVQQALSQRAFDFFVRFGLLVQSVGLKMYGPTLVTQETGQAGAQLQARAEATARLLGLEHGRDLPPEIVAAVAGGATLPSRNVLAAGTNGHVNGHAVPRLGPNTV